MAELLWDNWFICDKCWYKEKKFQSFENDCPWCGCVLDYVWYLDMPQITEIFKRLWVKHIRAFIDMHGKNTKKWFILIL
jgi:hypothetical protein